MTLFTVLIFVPLLVTILLLLNLLVAPSKPDLEKNSVYESGFSSVGGSRTQFSIAFYIVAILFLIFDLDLFVLYPLATCINLVSIYGLIIGVIFIFILTLGFVYEYSSGALSAPLKKKK